MPQTRLAYLSHPRISGATDLSNIAALTPTTQDGVRAAMNDAHSTDAHFVCYGLASGAVHPRINKTCAAHIVAAGDRVVLPFMAIDIDNPGHKRWDGIAGVIDLLDLLSAYGAHWWPASDWSFFYSTRAGARLVYTLKEPLSPDEWEQGARGLIAEFKRENFDVDPACRDWTRLFRLPDVMRDGVQQGDEPWAVVIDQADNRLDLATRDPDAGDFDRLFPRQQDDQVLDIRPTSDQPSPEDAHALMIRMVNGKQAMTEWHKEAKRALKGEPYYPALFESAPLAEEGDRDNTLHKTAGSVIGKLFGRFGTTLNHIYALLLCASEGFETDAGTPDWYAATWHKASSIWAKEEAKARAHDALTAATEETNLDTIGQMAAGMRLWCDHPDLTGDADLVADFVFRHLIVTIGREFYIMRPDGYYDTMPCNNMNLVPRIRALHGNDGIIQLRVVGEKTARWVTTQEIVNGHGTLVSEVQMACDDVIGGKIDKIDTQLATFQLSQFSRNAALAPTYHKGVDTWLRLLFGTDYTAGAKWIAWSLAFEEGPICGLSICGPSGIGKSLLADGLKECLTVPQASDFSELTGDWQYRLAQTPFVFADEGFGIGYQSSHPGDVFRRTIGRASTHAKRKNLAPMVVQTDVRFLFTANNPQLVRKLTEGRSVTPEDRTALMMRILHFDVDAAAADWLAANGGRRFTDGWVKGSGSSQSRFVVAKHFLWLYEQRVALGKDDRLLVEGNLSDNVMDELRLHAGQMDLIVQAIAQMVQAPSGTLRRQDTRITGDKLYVLPSDVHKTITQHMGLRISIAVVRDHLIDLVPAQDFDKHGKIRPTSVEGDRRRWYKVDTEFFVRTCDKLGFNIDNLRASDTPAFPAKPPLTTQDVAPALPRLRIAKSD